MAELKPCPFCGGKAEMHVRPSFEEYVEDKSLIPSDAKFCYEKVTDEYHRYYFRARIFIPRCTNTKCVGRTTKIFDSKLEAIEVWNRRVDNV